MIAVTLDSGRLRWELGPVSVAGIYAIHHDPTNSAYIGMAGNILDRWRTHVRELRQGRHHNERLQALWTSADPSEFRFVLLERMESREYIERGGSIETRWYEHYVNAQPNTRLLNAFPPGKSNGRRPPPPPDAESTDPD